MVSEGTINQVLAGEAQWAVVHSDCLDVLRTLPDECVDAIVTDAPYGLSKITEENVRDALACWLRGEPYLTKQRGFMGSTWDRFVPGPEVWRECCRVLRPGGYLLTFAGTRTQDLMAIALRLAGLEVRDTIAWLYSQAMAKSVNVERVIAMEQCTLPGRHFASTLPQGKRARDGDHLCPSTEDSLKWEDQGSALAPSHEPIIVARKPIVGTYAQNTLAHGTAMNIEACRIAHSGPGDRAEHEAGVAAIKARGGSMDESWKNASDLSGANDVSPNGRWPKNTLLSHHPDCRRLGVVQVAANPTWDTPNRQTEPSAFTGERVSKVRHGRAGEASAERRYTDEGSTDFAATPGPRHDVEDVEQWDCAPGCPVRTIAKMSGRSETKPSSGDGEKMDPNGSWGFRRPSSSISDSGTAARFYSQFHPSELDGPPFLYQAKPSRREKDAGLQHFRPRTAAEATHSEDGQQRLESPRTGAGRTGGARNNHPTSKSVDLCRWLTRLVARPGQVVLNPFAGGGSEGVAAVLEGCRWIGIEQADTDEEPFVSIARARLTHIDGGEFIPRESLRAPVNERPKQVTLFG